MIKVHKFGPAFGLPDTSPFVTKVETYLRIRGAEYEGVAGDVRKAPRKQLPVVEIDGEVIADSSDIIARIERGRSDKLDAHLDAGSSAVGLAFKSMLEEHFYFAMLYMRWATDDGWAVFDPVIREMTGKLGVPGFMRGLVAGQIRKKTIHKARLQGIGRRPREQVVAIASGILDALAQQLGERPWFLGDKPTTYDATVYAFVAGASTPAFDNELRKHAVSKPNLQRYAERIAKQYWS